MSVSLTLDLSAVNAHLEKLASVDTRKLLRVLAAEGESQTRRRISTEKTAPDGTPWHVWSDGYAKTRHGGQSLLESEGHFISSIESAVDGDSAIWGSNAVQAAALQFGFEDNNLQAREYLGISRENESDLQGIMEDWLSANIKA